jgi:Primase C terminal 2 (PriCT-2)
MKKRQIKIKDKIGLIELLGDGNQFIACGTHPSGVRYQWKDGLPDQIPTLSQEVVNSVWTTLTKTYATSESAKANQTALEPARIQTNQETLTEISDSEWQDLISALRFLKDHVNDNQTWSEIGYALLSLEGSRPARQLWVDFSRKAAGYEDGAPEQWWGSHRTQKTRTDYRHIFNMARQRGMARVADPEAFPPVPGSGDLTSPEAAGGGREAVVELPTKQENVGAGAEAEGAISVVPDAPTRPIIQIDEQQFSDIVDRLEGYLVPYAYVQGPYLVRETAAHSDAEIRRNSGALTLIHVTKEWLMKRFGELCDWQKRGRVGWIPTKPSVEHVMTLLGQGSWTQLRPLEAIARSPFVRPDGSVCETPGYDRRSRVLYVPSVEFPAIPENPSRGEAEQALAGIRSVFDQFPWKEPASESAFISHVLTEAARVAIPVSPMFFYDAPSAGTGKTLLQEMAARIVHGTEPALRPWVDNGDELRKALYSCLLAGDRSIWFDNIQNGHKTRSKELCVFITAPTYTDRKLGESESISVPNKCVLVGSGNNVTPTGDLARRSLVVRMDANTERLKERVFKISDLRAYVMEHRPQLLVYALTIIKAFHAVKGIKMPVPLPSFERWSHFCRDPLIWLGMEDPVATQKETDDESTSVGTIYETLVAQFGDREFTGLDIARLVNGIVDASGELANHLQENGCPEPNSPKMLGYWLRGNKDRISGGYKLVHAGEARTGVKWKLVRMNEDLT